MSGGGGKSPKKCGLVELLVFLGALASGTLCSIMSKNMMNLTGAGIAGEVERFEKPIFQTFGMFIGMLFALPIHWAVLALRLPFPGYDHGEDAALPVSVHDAATPGEKTRLVQKQGGGRPVPPAVPLSMYFFLAIPAGFDLVATALCMMGLRYLPVSIYQMLRGSGIIFVAIMKQSFLGDKLFSFQWVGIAYNVFSVLLVGAVAMLGGAPDDEEGDEAGSSVGLGVFLIILGAFVQALQYVFEEKVMSMDVPAPPLLLIGMEGFWGTVLCLAVAYPLVYYLPGTDHGSYEDPFNTWYMLMHSRTIQAAFVVYFFTIFAYNFLAVMVTFLLNSVWHAILDNFRPITIWTADLALFYCLAPSLGEEWTRYSWMQVAGLFVLLYGTAVYNAPNPGSVKLRGEWFSLGLDYGAEYDGLEAEAAAAAEDEGFQGRMLEKRTMSSFRGELAANLR